MELNRTLAAALLCVLCVSATANNKPGGVPALQAKDAEIEQRLDQLEADVDAILRVVNTPPAARCPCWPNGASDIAAATNGQNEGHCSASNLFTSWSSFTNNELDFSGNLSASGNNENRLSLTSTGFANSGGVKSCADPFANRTIGNLSLDEASACLAAMLDHCRIPR